MDEVVGSAKVVLEGIDKISPAVATSMATLKKWGDSGADIQQKLIQAAQKHHQTIHALNQIYQQNQQAAKAAGTVTAQGFQAGIQQAQKFTQAAGQVPSALFNVGQAAKAVAGPMAAYFAVREIEEFIRKSYMAFTSQEEHMRRVQLAMGGSAEEIKKIHGELNDLAGKTGSTTEKMTDAFRDFMSRSGLGSGEAMQAFRGVVEAADEAGVSVHDMSRIATAAMAQLKVSTYDMPQLLGSMGKAFAGLGDDATKVMPNIINSMQRIGLEGKDNLQGALAIIEINKKKMGDAAGPAFESEMRLLADPNSITGRLVDDQVKAAGEGARNTINEHMLFVDIERDILKRASGDWYRMAREEEYYFGTDQQLIVMLRKDAEGKREDLLAEYQAEQKVLGGVKEIDEAHKKFMEGSIKETRALTQEFTNLMAAVGGFLDSIGATDTLHSTVTDLKNIKEFLEWVEGPKDEEGKEKDPKAPSLKNWWNLGVYTHDALEAAGIPVKPYDKPKEHKGMQSGGVVTEPTMTMIGEAGPEAVVPLTRGGDMRGSSGGTQAERDAASMWGRLHGHAMTRTAHVDRHGQLTQEVIDKLMGGGGSAGGGGGAGITGGGGSSGGGGASGTSGDGKTSTTGGDGKTVTGSGVLEGPAKGEFGKGGNLSAAQLVKSGVDPLLVESVQQGAKRAFGDPNDKNTRYVVQMQGGIRPGSPRHTPGKAIDLQIYDRQTGQFIGGKGDIMKNAFGNPTTYRTYEILAQARYQYVLEKHGKAAADRMSWGGRFGKSRQGAGPDEMHFSLDERGALGPVTEAARGPYSGPTGTIAGWLKGAGAAPSEGMGDDPKAWKSPLNPANEPKKMAKGGVVTKPTLAMVGESGPEAVVPLKDANEMGEGLGGGDADIGNYTYQASSTAQFDMHELARRNAQILRPGIKRARPSFTDVLRQNPQLGIPEGQAGGPGGSNLYGGSEFEELKAIERNLERPDEKQLKYGQELEQGGLGYYERRGGWRKDLGGFDAAYGGSSGGAGASGNYPAFGGGFGGGSTESTPPGLQFGSVDEAKRALGVRPELTEIVKQAQHDNPDLPFVVAPQGGTRTQAEQDALVKRGVSRTRQSAHLGGNAIDVVPLINGKMDWDSPASQAAYTKIEEAMFAAAEKQKTPIGPEHAAIRSWDPGHFSMPPKGQTTAVTPLPKSRPASAQASAQDHFNKNPIHVPVAPANLGAHRQSFARSSGWAQRRVTARRATHEATVHAGEM